MTKHYADCCDPDTPRIQPVRGEPFSKFIDLNRQYTCAVLGVIGKGHMQERCAKSIQILCTSGGTHLGAPSGKRR